MRQWLRSYLTFANVCSLAALFVALGGTTYAATGGNFILGQSNSASSTTSLTRTGANAGKGLQVTNNSTTAGATAVGLNVAAGHAPFTVNSGTKVANLNADKLDGLDSTAVAQNGSEAWHEVGGAGEPPFNSTGTCTWGNFQLPNNTAAFLRDRFGFVHLKGAVDADGTSCPPGATSEALIFNLPAGYRPAAREVFATLTNSELGRVNVAGPVVNANQGAGAVSIDPPTTEVNAKQWLMLDGISFRCAPSGSDGCP